MTLTHLKKLEAESIHIFREVAAEFDNPVMLYSVGKDSAVLLHLARKAFAPGKIPFPLLHVDTNWKFKEMIAFRDKIAKEYDFELSKYLSKYLNRDLSEKNYIQQMWNKYHLGDDTHILHSMKIMFEELTREKLRNNDY